MSGHVTSEDLKVKTRLESALRQIAPHTRYIGSRSAHPCVSIPRAPQPIIDTVWLLQENWRFARLICDTSGVHLQPRRWLDISSQCLLRRSKTRLVARRTMEPSIRPTVVRVRGFVGLKLEVAEASLRRVIDERLPASLSDNSYEFSFVPSCDDENESVALVEFRHGLPEFLSQLRQNPLGSWQVFANELNDDLSFDRHFIGFTQLYDLDSPRDIIAEYGSLFLTPTVPWLTH